MQIAEKITESVWKIAAGSNIYILNMPSEKILIDAGDRAYRSQLSKVLDKVINPEEVSKVIFTHMHFDHVGNFDFFPNAEFFASSEEIKNFRKNPEMIVLKEDIAEKLKSVNIKPIEQLGVPELEIINTPGHTSGSICIWFEKEKVLFTGDTIFKEGYGRTDLPTSDQQELQKSVVKLLNYNYKHMCPGHGRN